MEIKHNITTPFYHTDLWRYDFLINLKRWKV